jgi:O-acetyl-ADP-ribose deacetylase (regulator of RNase III)
LAVLPKYSATGPAAAFLELQWLASPDVDIQTVHPDAPLYRQSEDLEPAIMAELVAVQGDITTMRVDAIVNAANTSLLGGGGVDGAIHRAAGPDLLAECRKLRGCETGNGKATPGFKLPAKWIFHVVGPVWHGGGGHEDELLESCYRRSLELARQHQVRTIAFPAISTGVYGFPPKRAAHIAIETVRENVSASGVEVVRFACFDAETMAIYEKFLAEPPRASVA